MFGSWSKDRKRKKLLAQPLSDEWRRIIERNVAVYALLPTSQKQRLEEATRIIVAERTWEGCKGLVVTQEMKVTIAAQASLLVLGDQTYLFDRVTTILIYPWPMRGNVQAESNVLEEDVGFSGRASRQGEIILSWPDVLAGGRDPRDSHNVVLHEFAHHLDGLDGDMGGAPPLAPDELERWLAVANREQDRLIDDLNQGRPTPLNPGATQSLAELFAYGTECFFEQPAIMRQRHPELFDGLRRFYQIDPAVWFEDRPDGASDAVADATEKHGPGPNQADVDDHPGEPASHDGLPPLATTDQYFTRGCDYFELGRYDLAEADFNQAVRLAPDDQEALLYRARARFFLDHLEAALADADRACRLAPNDKEAAWVRAICRSALGQFEEALADFEQATDAVTDNIDALFYRGLARAECGYVKQAIGDFSRVIELDPEDADAWYERSCCYEMLGNSTAGARDLDAARKLGLEVQEETEGGAEG